MIPVPGKTVEEPTAKYKPGKAGKFHVISNETEMEEYLHSVRENMVKILKPKLSDSQIRFGYSQRLD